MYGERRYRYRVIRKAAVKAAVKVGRLWPDAHDGFRLISRQERQGGEAV
jgi:hypothetical protein